MRTNNIVAKTGRPPPCITLGYGHHKQNGGPEQDGNPEEGGY